MKKLLIISIIILVSSCNFSPNKQNESTAATETKTELNKDTEVELIYFHGKKRCITCNAIEKLTKEVLEESFAKETENGKISIKVIDFSTKEGEKLANKYEVAWSALFINDTDLSPIGFKYAKNEPEVFKTKLKEEIIKLLN